MSSILREISKGRLGNHRPSFFLELSVTQRTRPKQDLQYSAGWPIAVLAPNVKTHNGSVGVTVQLLHPPSQ